MMSTFRSTIGDFLIAHRWGIFILILINILHNVGLTTSPEYFFDEFLYSARAWAFVKFGTLEMPPDLESFDHPPLGWMIMGVVCSLMVGLQWTVRARIFMSIVFGISTITMYGIGVKYYNKITGIVAAIFFGGIAGFIDLQKEILLDNIGVMFLLLAIYCIFKHPMNESILRSEDQTRIRLDFKSAIFLGLAIVTKFPFAMFYPALILFYYTHSQSFAKFLDTNQRKEEIRRWIKWIICSLIPLALFVLYIIISGNFVKFLDASWVQLTRVNPDASLITLYAIWIAEAPLFFIEVPILSVFFICIGIIFGIKNLRKSAPPVSKNKRFKVKGESGFKYDLLLRYGFEIAVFNAIYLLFLIRGGFVLPHYIIPLGPLGGLLLTIFIVYAIRPFFINMKDSTLASYENNLKKGKGFRAESGDQSAMDYKRNLKASLICGLLLGFWIGIHLYPYQYASPSVNQNEYLEDTFAWVIANVPKDSFIVVYGFYTAELREAGFTYAQSIWFMDYTSLQGDPLIIDYFICPTLGTVITDNTQAAVDRAVLIMSFSQGEGDALKTMGVYQVIK